MSPPPAMPPVQPQAVAARAAAAAAAAAAATGARISQLEAAIEADPNNVAAWDARLSEAVKEGNPTEWFERAVVQFPLGARIWGVYAEWCETQDPVKALAIYRRCLQSVPMMNLWMSYLSLSKRHRSLEAIFKAYSEALDLLGTDARAGNIWVEYLTLLKHAYNLVEKKVNPDAEVSGRLLAEDLNPIETARRGMKPVMRKKAEEDKALDIGDDEFLRVGELIGVNASMLRGVFQRAVCTAHVALDKIWVAYEQFEKSLGNPQFAQKLLSEYQPTYIRGKAASKELQTICQGIDFLAVPIPPQPQNIAQQEKSLDRWRRLVHYERTNPLRLGRTDVNVRVSLVYQQASMGLAYHADIWYDFISWLDLSGQRERATQVLRQAIQRFLPQDLTLRLLLAHRHELVESPLSVASSEMAENEYQSILDDMPTPCPLALINKLAFVRRQKGATVFRGTFLEATQSSRHCTWEVYVFAALTEYHVFGEFNLAVKVFRYGLEKYGDREPSLLAAYVNFLDGANDLNSARSELSRSIFSLAGGHVSLKAGCDSSRKESFFLLWQKWTRLERYFGDARGLQRTMEVREESCRNSHHIPNLEGLPIMPVSLGFSTSLADLMEGFRFQHLVPRSKSVRRIASPESKGTNQFAQLAAAEADGCGFPCATRSLASPVVQTVNATVDDIRRTSFSPSAPTLTHIARPDVSKMLAFRPALDVVGPRLAKHAPITMRNATTGGRAPPSHVMRFGTVVPAPPRAIDRLSLPTMIPKCLQDLLAVLPSRPLQGNKPDVDYMLTVFQTVAIPSVPVKELEQFRYGSLRLAKESDGLLGLQRSIKDEASGLMFENTPSFYRDRLQAKRRRVMGEEFSSKLP